MHLLVEFKILLTLVVLNYITFAQQQKTTKAQAIEIAKTLTSKQDVNVYISKQTLIKKTEISTMYKTLIAPDYESYLIFIDEHPFQSWWHDCKYVFVNTNTGKYKTVNMKYPPDMKMMNVVKEKTVTEKGKLFYFEKHTKNFTTTDNEWAVIINGGYNKDNNHERYWNHCSAIYSALINVYGYREDHIFVLMSDGTNPAADRHLISGGYDSSPLDLDGDGDNDIQFAATRANITNVFNTLSGLLNADDNLFVYTTDHGGQVSGQDAFIYLWGQTMRDDQFATEVNKINAQKINFCLVQCHSGGFIDDLQANNRVIATSCRYDESAYAMPNLMYSEFTYYWISAIAGKTPEGNTVNADANNDGFISMLEAFNYAKNHDTQQEHPQYSSMPATTGRYLSLLGTIPHISGTNTVCTSNRTFTLHNRPPGAGVKWAKSSNLTYVSGGQGTNNYRVKAKSSSTSGKGWVKANVNGKIVKKTIWIGKPNFTLKGDYELDTRLMGIAEIQYKETSQQGITNTGWGRSDAITRILGGPVIAKYWAGSRPGTGTVDLTLTNQCGSKFKYFIVKVTGGHKAYPNPVNDILTIEIDKSKINNKSIIDNIEVRLYDKFMTLKKYSKTKGSIITINVNDLSPDVYILQIKNGDKIFEEKIVISDK